MLSGLRRLLCPLGVGSSCQALRGASFQVQSEGARSHPYLIAVREPLGGSWVRRSDPDVPSGWWCTRMFDQACAIIKGIHFRDLAPTVTPVESAVAMQKSLNEGPEHETVRWYDREGSQQQFLTHPVQSYMDSYRRHYQAFHHADGYYNNALETKLHSASPQDMWLWKQRRITYQSVVWTDPKKTAVAYALIAAILLKLYYSKR